VRANPQFGEVYFVDLGMAAKPRFVFIVSTRDTSAPLALVTALSITTQYHGSRYEVTLPRVPFLREQSHVNAQSVQPFKLVELGRLLGKFEEPILEHVRNSLRRWLAL
jgi:mRNA interferase MazF